MNPLDKIREMAGRVADLTDDELAELKALVSDYVGTLDDDDNAPETVTVLEELAGVLEAVRAQETTNAQAKADAEEKGRNVRARIAKAQGGEPDEDEDDGADGDDKGAGGGSEGDEGSDANDEGDKGGEGAGTETREPVGAGVQASGRTRPRATAGAMSRATGGTRTRSPELRDEVGRPVLTASGLLPGFRSGDPIDDRMAFAQAAARQLDRMSRNDRPQGRALLASAEWGMFYPEERRLGNDADLNTRRMQAAYDDLLRSARGLEALLATGGICQPVNIDWTLETWAVADRPLRDALAQFVSSRGGLQYRIPVDFSALADAVGVWTEATDANPEGATKPVMSIACPDLTTVFCDAVTLRLGFGNMQSRFDPETVAEYTDLSVAAHAQVAELNLLSKIRAAAVADVTSGPTLGASRDIATTIIKALSFFRNLHRMSDDQVVAFALPRWVRDLIIIDRVNELAHDDAGTSPWELTYEWVDSLFTSRKAKPIWLLDGEPTNGGIPAQSLAAFAASSAFPSYPTKVAWYMWIEGTVQFLDGGRLDLGVVRDSTLDATNDYETFVETFEGIATRGFASSIVQFVTHVCANGQSGASATVSGCY